MGKWHEVVLCVPMVLGITLSVSVYIAHCHYETELKNVYMY